MMKKLNLAEAEQVRLAWERRYREQEDVLVWPEAMLPDFISAVEPLKPIEAKLDFPTPPQQELKVELRNRYRDYIRQELPKLADIIGAEWRVGQQGGGASGMTGMGGGSGMPGMPGMGGMGGGSMMPGMGSGGTGYPGMGGGSMRPGAPGGMGSGGGSMMPGAPGGMGSGGGSMMPGMGSGGSGMPGSGMGGSSGSGGTADLLTADGKPIVVEWSPSNQAALQAACMNWSSPTTLQILYSQEDLWVLRSLMLIIKATNGDADAQYNAAVKEVMSIELGAAAPGIKSVGGVGGSGGGGMMGSGGSPMPGSSMMPGGSGSSVVPAAAGLAAVGLAPPSTRPTPMET